MKESAQILKNTMAIEDFEKMLEQGIRTGDGTFSECVFLLDEIKNSYVEEIGYREDLPLEDLIRILENDERAGILQEVFVKNHIPVRKEHVLEVKEFFSLLDSLEEINDGMCEFILRNGVEPTVYNMARLQFEKESGYGEGSMASSEPESKRNDIALAWSFPKEEETDEEKVIPEWELTADELTKSSVRWLRKKGIYTSAQNIKLLNCLWSLDLPIADEEALLHCVNALRSGKKMQDSILWEAYPAWNGSGKKDVSQGDVFEDVSGDVSEERKKEQDISGADAVLKRAEELYRREYFRNHSGEEYLKAEYEAFLETVFECDEEVAILNFLSIPVTPDAIFALRFLQSDEGGIFFEKTAFFIGAKKLLSAFRKKDIPKAGENEGYQKLLKAVDEKLCSNDKMTVSEYREIVRICKVLILMQKMAEKGYEEIPLLLGKKWIRLRIRRESGNRFTAIVRNDITGGLMIKYSENEGSVSVLVVGEREDVLREFQESNLLTERLKKAGKEDFSVTYFLQPEFAYDEHFYRSDR